MGLEASISKAGALRITTRQGSVFAAPYDIGVCNKLRYERHAALLLWLKSMVTVPDTSAGTVIPLKSIASQKKWQALIKQQTLSCCYESNHKGQPISISFA